MTPTSWLSLALVALLSSACVPSFSSLMAARRYGDATCHARTRAEAETLVRAVEHDADVRVSLYAVHERELEAALGDKGKEIAGKVTFVRVKSAMNSIPSNASVGTALSVAEKDRVLDLGARGSLSDSSAAVLFALTGETLPSSRTVIDEQKLTKEIGWAIFTLGLKQLLFGTDNVSHTVTPGQDDYARSGPKAMAIVRGLHGAAAVDAYAIPRSLEGSTTLVVHMSAMSIHEDYGSCTLSVDQTISLSRPEATLTEVIDERFHNEAKHPSEVGATHGYSVSNPYGSWSSEPHPPTTRK